jgi:hypothetical protein
MMPLQEYGSCRRGLYVPAKLVATRSLIFDALEGVVQVQGRLSASQEQVAVLPQQSPHPAQDLPLRLHVEVDEHVADQENVNRRQCGPRLNQVDLPVLHQRPDVVLELPLGASPLEVLDEHLCRQPAVDLQLAVAASASLLQHVDRQVAGNDADIPAGEGWEVFAQQ